MLHLISLLAFMGITSRQAGGGFGAHRLPRWLTWLPEVLFAIPFGLPLFLLLVPHVGSLALLPAFLAVAWSYLWMQSATAPGLHWGKGGYNPNRTSTLKPYVDFLNNLRVGKWSIGPGYDPSTAQYCRLYMSVKGFLIGLPVGGIPLAVFWPLGYELGHRTGKEDLIEFFAGIGAGVAVGLALLVI